MSSENAGHRVRPFLHQLEQWYSPTVYQHNAEKTAFPLGGIGTGTISLSSSGSFVDWEIFGRPGKGNRAPYSFFAVHTSDADGFSDSRVLEGPIQGPHDGANGHPPEELPGLPRFAESRLQAAYPYVWVSLESQRLQITLEAFTPFVPLDVDSSAIPATLIRYYVHNTSDMPQTISVAGSVANLAGLQAGYGMPGLPLSNQGHNEVRKTEVWSGVFMEPKALARDDLRFGTIALASRGPEVSYKPSWACHGHLAGIHDFWSDFSSDGLLWPSADDPSLPKSRLPVIGSVATRRSIAPGECGLFEFVLAWCFPNRVRSWNEDRWIQDHPRYPETRPPQMLLRHGRRFTDAWQVIAELTEKLDELEKRSRAFTHALYSSTLPREIIESVGNNLAILRSPTCFVDADDTFYGWEGVDRRNGSCSGNCTHVWNYELALGFLFPELSWSMRQTEFLTETDPDGRMAFRALRVMGDERHKHKPAADGQAGAIIRAYRDLMKNGSLQRLESLWPRIRAAARYLLTEWDTDGDAVPDGEQHCTYDTELYGPNPYIAFLFCAAYSAAARLAIAAGDSETAQLMADARRRATGVVDALFWNGHFYTQPVSPHPYQYSHGCLADQLLGQFMADGAGLPSVAPQERVSLAMRSVVRHNFVEDHRGVRNLARSFAVRGEGGVRLCAWPTESPPAVPMIYSDEVWTGVEYQVSASLIRAGRTAEALTLLRAVRRRYDGRRRNPFAEIEAGYHYARALSSFGLLLAASGQSPRGNTFRTWEKLAFDPAPEVTGNTGEFRCLYVSGKSWGRYVRRSDGAETIESDFGPAPSLHEE